ncbi:SpoIVB peptidase S55 domain-containing protein [Nocardioides ferulae]|uniref:SpoIVB peptidase S55 domain-containing protein n=1 Tax=Nocardioides ferulae TaxID=2340821 RepID=UPI0013DE1BA9|nr:SpoIVB peptidase S55 domain-containing protein [Nocardioides ferulae]
MSSLARRRGRTLASLSATLGLGLATLAVAGGTTAAQAADPVLECPTPFPVSEVTKGQAVTGLTVTEGTTPTGFTGEVIGVLEDGVTVGVDMIMIELDSPEIQRVGGIWQGMSGSPVYAEDGRLLGAVAYGMSYGASPVAGITPYSEMDDYLGTEPAGKVQIDRATAKAIAKQTDVTVAQASQGARQLPMPLGVSGLGARRLAGVEKAENRLGERGWLLADTYSVGAAAEGGPTAADVVPGGNVAASLSYGDVTQAGVGTVTSVCGDDVTAFGHPMTFLGETTMSLHPADVLYVQRETVGPPFKLANLGLPAGTVTDDHTTGLTGFIGALPESVEITTATAFPEGDRSRTGTSHASVRTPDNLASTSFYQVVLNHDRVLDSYTPGSELMAWTITGTDIDGSPFELSLEDRYASSWDLSYEMGYALGDWVYMISQIPGVEVTSIDADSSASSDDDTDRVEGVQQWRGGEWVTVNRKNKARVKAGGTLKLQYLLEAPDGTITEVPFELDVPRKAAGSRAYLQVTGGAWLYSYGRVGTVEKAAKKLANMVRNDEVEAELEMWIDEGERGGNSDRRVVKDVSGPYERVVEGRERVRVIIR